MHGDGDGGKSGPDGKRYVVGAAAAVEFKELVDGLSGGDLDLLVEVVVGPDFDAEAVLVVGVAMADERRDGQRRPLVKD